MLLKFKYVINSTTETVKKKVLGGDLPAKGLHTANTRHSRSLEAGTAVRLLGCGRKSEGGCMSSMPSSVKVTLLISSVWGSRLSRFALPGFSDAGVITATSRRVGVSGGLVSLFEAMRQVRGKAGARV